MHAACFEVKLRIPGAASLKERRSVVRSLKERVRNRFNVSVIEYSGDDKWQMARLGFALAAVSLSAARKSAQDIVTFIENDGRADVLGVITYGEDS